MTRRTDPSAVPSGPLAGLRGVEMAGIGPGPFAAMMLADLGADIVRVERPGLDATAYSMAPQFEVLNRGRRSIAVDVKHDDGRRVVERLVERSDFLIEGFRPGAMERLGLGPEPLLALNPRLVYGRMTGWGQDGPMAQHAGHDLNYLALTGVLSLLGRRGQPPGPPLNVIGDFGGGGLLLAFGIAAALTERASSGRGQVVDAAIVDGVSLLGSFLHAFRAAGDWVAEREANLIDGGAHMYDVYETADGRWLAIAAIEEKFYVDLCEGLGVDRGSMPDPIDRASWLTTHDRITEIIRTRTQAEWVARFDGKDACVTPVLDIDAAMAHPHATARRAFIDIDGVPQPAPAPRFGRTAVGPPGPPPIAGSSTISVLTELGFSNSELASLRQRSVITEPPVTPSQSQKEHQ